MESPNEKWERYLERQRETLDRISQIKVELPRSAKLLDDFKRYKYATVSERALTT